MAGKKSWGGRILYFFNILFALGLLLSYLAYYIPPNFLSLPSYAAVGYPFLLLMNLLFIIIWLVKFDRRLILSLLVILLGYKHVQRTYQLGDTKVVVNPEERIKVMSYNVRLFNSFNWLEDTEVEQKIIDLISQQAPDVLLIQEFQKDAMPAVQAAFNYPYKHSQIENLHQSNGMVIFSNFPIINSGVIDVEKDTTSGMQFQYADIEWQSKKIRFINVHLASVGLEDADYDLLENPESRQQNEIQNGLKVVVNRLHRAFVRRNIQIEAVKKVVMDSPHPVVLCGDFNDVPQSYAYHQMDQKLEDSFLEGGEGFGKTYIRSPLPLRIDYIFHSEEFRAFNFKTIPQELSDHYPIVTELEYQP